MFINYILKYDTDMNSEVAITIPCTNVCYLKDKVEFELQNTIPFITTSKTQYSILDCHKFIKHFAFEHVLF